MSLVVKASVWEVFLEVRLVVVRAAWCSFKALRADRSAAGHDVIFRHMDLYGCAEFAVMLAVPC